MENEKRYKVKEMADLLGMSTQTLRRYDDLGIIFPERGDDNDYRFYKMSDMIQLLRLQSLRNCGFGLKESCGVYAVSLENAVEAYGAHADGLQKKIERLRRCEQMTRLQQQRLQYWKRLKTRGFELRERPACRVFFYRNIHRLMDYQEVKEHLGPIIGIMPPMRSCVVRAQKDILAGSSAYQGGLFAFASELEDCCLPEDGTWAELPPCRCMVVAVEGFGMTNFRRHAQAKKTDNERRMEQVFQMVKENGFSINGDMLGEVLHMWRQPESEEVPGRHNFRHYDILWIPVQKAGEAAENGG